MGFPPRKVTAKQIDDAVESIRKYLAEGDGIVTARKKSGISNYDTQLARGVRLHRDYLPMLNEYMIRIGKPVFYAIHGGKFKAIKRI